MPPATQLLLCLLLPLPVVLGEPEEYCPRGEPCIRKCCPHGQMIVMSKCVPLGAGGVDLRLPHPHLPLVHSKPDCEMYYIDKDEEHSVLHNGTLLYDDQAIEYCIEWNHLNDTFTYVCFPPEDEALIESQVLRVYSVGVWISLPFLLVTFLVYASLRKLWNLHGRCITFHTLSMLIAYLSLGLIQNKLMEMDPQCTILGYAIQFFFMATFFWLNVMCFDIYWTFSGLKGLTGSAKERERKKLILYSLYAWGVPLLILLVTLGIDYAPSIPATSIWKPNVGVDRCFFKEATATGIYFYMPMGVVILINILLFAITAYRICSLRRETSACLGRGDSRKHDSKKNTSDRERFSLYFKLFLVMGINWAMELVSYLAGGPRYIWYIPDFTNTLQGVFIFIIFVWKKRVRRLIWARLQECCGKGAISSSSNGSTRKGGTQNTSTLTTASSVQNSMKLHQISPPPTN